MDDSPSPPGFAPLGFPVAPAEHLLRLPGFWPAYYGPTWDAFAEEPELFGADGADVDAAAEALYGPADPWPAYRLPLAGGHTLWIVHRNHPDDSGTDYLITHPAWSRPGHLASIEGHFSGPGLSWPELSAVVGSAPHGAEGVLDPGTRLLLLLPAFGDADAPPEEAKERVADALTAAGMAAGAARAAAGRFLDHPFWDGPTWTVQGRSPLSGSTAEPSPLPLCDGPHSPRTVPLARGITADQERALAAALTGRHHAVDPDGRMLSPSPGSP
ncbi:hypothetical protein ACFV99_37255 [Streptomyces sp. NPDC059944]|uniref:hypothetical protein n=1 Tax=unclassified Streptomyces TaxID=2593676 RepID=UPI0036647160